MVEPAAQAGRAVRELVHEGAVTRVEVARRDGERAVEPAASLDLLPHRERRPAGGGRTRQSSIPVVGEDGTAISRDGILPARNARRPATTACFIAYAMRTGSSAAARAVFISTPSTPCSMVMHASDAVPTPASTITGTCRRRLISRMK